MKRFLLFLCTVNIFGLGKFAENCLEKQPHKLTLYAPWRDHYEEVSDVDNSIKHECPFCYEIEANKDSENFILYRSNSAIVMLNLYPYEKGHMLIIPYKHVRTLNELSYKERVDLIELANFTSTILQTKLGATGVNIGINMGNNSGASVPGHVHIHILPRFNNHHGFIQLIGNTEVISWDMQRLYVTLKPCFNTLINN